MEELLSNNTSSTSGDIQQALRMNKVAQAWNLISSCMQALLVQISVDCVEKGELLSDLWINACSIFNMLHDNVLISFNVGGDSMNTPRKNKYDNNECTKFI